MTTIASTYQSTIKKKSSIFQLELLGSSMIIDKNMNFGLIHISNGVIRKYISFLYATSHFLASSRFITSMPTGSVLGQICIFKIVQHEEVWTNVNFLVS